MRVLDIIAMILVTIGGINWGLVGIFDFNLVSFLFGSGTLLTNIIYAIVGVSAIYLIFPMANNMHATEVMGE